MYKTDHKLELINIFENNKDKTYSAVALVEELKEKMNKTTIYRQLKSLEKNSTIRRVYNPNTHPKQETLNKLSQKAKEYQKKKRIEKFNKEYTIEQINKTIELLKEGESLKDILNETKLTIKDILLIKNKKIYERI